jgi:ribose 5-phosphate isomerase A
VVAFDSLELIDVAVDGADQIGPDRWLVKGGHGAQAREKVVAGAAARFVVIASSNKLVDAVGPPVPLEVLRFGLAATLARVRVLGPCEQRGAGASPDGNVIADYLGPVDDPAELSARLSAIPGLVEHGLFPPGMVSEVLVGLPGGGVRTL